MSVKNTMGLKKSKRNIQSKGKIHKKGVPFMCVSGYKHRLVGVVGT